MDLNPNLNSRFQKYLLFNNKEWILQRHPDKSLHPLLFRKDSESYSEKDILHLHQVKSLFTFQQRPVSLKVGVCLKVGVAAALRSTLRGFSHNQLILVDGEVVQNYGKKC